MKIGFVGAGNMGGAILSGLLASGIVPSGDVMISQSTPERTERRAAEFGVMPAASSSDLVRQCQIIFLGVEPGVIPSVLEEIKLVYHNRKIIISMAAGIMVDSIEKILGKDAKVIRIMPNTPAKVGESMISMSRNGNVSDGEMEEAAQILSTIGKTEEVPEDMIHAVIGVSGSSPAYTYMYIQGLADAAAAQGMDPAKARAFAAQAVLGAAKIVQETDRPLDDLIAEVCTPGGTTYEAVTYFREHGLRELVKGGADAAIRRSKEMSKA